MAETMMGKYRLISPLAQGGMAEIFLAKHEGPGGFEKDVVIKRVHRHLAIDPRFTAMFLDEARLAARLSHPNIVSITDLGEVDGSYFLCMERLEGADLSTILRAYARKKQQLPAILAAVIASAVCDGLFFAHNLKDAKGQSLGLVHRDLSPSNIYVTYQGAVKLLDFGIAKVRDRTVKTETGAGELKGKISYMSPEQARCEELDCRSDIFALGVVLYEMVTGVRPFQRGDIRSSLAAVINGRVEPPRALRADLPAELDAIITTAMHPQVSERFQTAEGMRQALDAFLSGCTTGPTASLMQNFMTEFREGKTPAAVQGTTRASSPTVVPAPGLTEPVRSASLQTLTGQTGLQGRQAEVATAAKPPPPPKEEMSTSPRRARVTGIVAVLLLVAALAVVRLRMGGHSSEVRQVQRLDVHEATPPVLTPVSKVKLPPIEAGKDATAPPVPGQEKKGNPSGSEDQAQDEPPSRIKPPAPKVPNGYLTVQCSPHWCKVFIDEKSYGYSPARNVPLPRGTHRVRIVAPQVEQSDEVRIAPNENAVKTFEEVQ